MADMISASHWATIVSTSNVSPELAASSSVRMSAETWYSAVTGSSNSSRMYDASRYFPFIRKTLYIRRAALP